MPNKKNIFSEEIELSETVLRKTNQAFEMIRQEEICDMRNWSTGNKNTGNRKFFHSQIIAAAAVGILAVGGISAVAAVRHRWGQGMNQYIEASETKQQELTEKGIAEVYRERPDYAALSVTDNGITIAPDTVIVDDRFAYLSFGISGYDAADGVEPGFETVTVYQGDEPESEDAWVNMNAVMFRETMEYIVRASAVDTNDSILGKTLHVHFENLGDVSKAGFALEAAGSWDFEIVLPDVSSAKEIAVGKKVDGTDFMMESISVSPISMRANYSVSAAPETKEDDLGIPEVKGVVLKDGTRIPYLIGGSRVGYTDSTRTSAYQIAGYNQVIDVDEVAALLVLTEPGGEPVEVEM